LKPKPKKRIPIQDTPAELKHWAMLLVTAVIWGSSFILIKRGLFAPDGRELFSPIQVGAIRIVVAALFMVPIVLNKIKVLKNGKLKYLLVVGLFGNGIPAFLFALAQTKIPSGVAGMLNALVPIFSMIIGLIFFSVKIKNIQVVGLLLGLIGAIGLIGSGGMIDTTDMNMVYPLLVVAATICYAISLNTIKQFLQDQSAIAITGLALLLVSPAGLIILLNTDFFFQLEHVPGAWTGFGAISILAILGTAIALMIFNKMVKETSTIFASSVTYLIPLIAIFWGMVDGESLEMAQILCALTMLGGIFLINRT